jgi:hypothetical protein
VVLLFLVLGAVYLFRRASGSTALFPFRFATEPTVRDSNPTTNSDLTVVETETKVVVTEQPPGGEELTITNILNEPLTYLGQAVSVSGYTREQVDPWGFSMTPTQSSEDEILILILTGNVQHNQLQNSFESSIPVRVSGTLKELTTEYEESFGLEEDDLSLVPWANQFVIVANNIEKI